MEDVGGDGPSLPLSQLGLLPVTLAPASSSFSSSGHSQQQQQQQPTIQTALVLSADSVAVPDFFHRSYMIYIPKKKKILMGYPTAKRRELGWVCGFVIDGKDGADGLMGRGCNVRCGRDGGRGLV